jgi:hypothetical protein
MDEDENIIVLNTHYHPFLATVTTIQCPVVLAMKLLRRHQ